MKKFYFFLLLVIFLEGYAVLSIEILAIRQLIPFVGNGLESVSILISAILIPLSFGYYVGGKFKGNVRQRLINNLICANIVLILSLSYNLLQLYFSFFSLFGIKNYIWQTCIFAIIFLIYPIFLLGQTIPLLSNYFRKNNFSALTGKILFVSTLGSFSGSILSTLFFMPLIGVNNTVIVTVFFVGLATLIINKNCFSYNSAIVVFSMLVCLFLNYPKLGIVTNNAYSTIEIIENNEEESKILSINRSYSAKIAKNLEDRFEYLKFVEKRFLEPLVSDYDTIYEILVIGAGGFTFGLEDKKNHYTYVDIDNSLEKISEKYFLSEPLSANKKFIAEPARAFVKNNDKKFDLIFLDVYTHYINIPFQLITKEFFHDVKSLLNDQAIFIFNAITSANFNDNFSIKLDNTIRSSFPNCNREMVGFYNGWELFDNKLYNVIYSCFNKHKSGIYSDNHNVYFFDK
ncbi:MAG: fused MFS/spermidine synthase [Rickettsiaceae bacterium H1]|nr:fused MFS/spermidine synthase [Rickettsiaceae bacterium H1]